MSTIGSLSGAGSVAGTQSLWGVNACNGSSGGNDTRATSGTGNTNSPLFRAIEQALSRLGTASSDSFSSTSSASSGASSDSADSTGDTEAAVQSFMQTLLAALQQAGGNLPPPPPPDASDRDSDATDTGLTKDQLTSMASQLSPTDSRRADFLSSLATNFDTADTNGDGKIDRQEAITFAQSSGTTDASAPPPFHHGGKGRLEADIDNLLQELSSSGSGTASGTTTDSSTSTDSDSTDIAQLQQSFQDLLSAFGVSSDSASLNDFLRTLETSLQGAPSTGNVVSTKA